MELSKEELEKFNIELTALLIRYNVNLSIESRINIVRKQPNDTPEIEESSEVAKSE